MDYESMVNQRVGWPTDCLMSGGPFGNTSFCAYHRQCIGLPVDARLGYHTDGSPSYTGDSLRISVPGLKGAWLSADPHGATMNIRYHPPCWCAPISANWPDAYLCGGLSLGQTFTTLDGKISFKYNSQGMVKVGVRV